MKLFFSFFLLFLFQEAFPRTVLIGAGTGAVIKNDMRGLHAGDTLAVRAGRYEKGGSFFNLNHITIINSGGILDFGQSVSIGNLSHVSISGAGVKGLKYGIRFQNIQGDAFLLEAPCNSLSISSCEYTNLDGSALNAARFFTTYNGDTATMALYKTTLSNQKLVHSGSLFTGSWASPGSFQNVVDSIAFLNVIVDSTSNSEVNQVIGNSVYRMLASDWIMKGPCPGAKHDVGVFQTAGNGTLRNIYRRGGWGYLWRCRNLGLNGRADSYIYNCIDIGTENYGMVDNRLNPNDTTTGNTIPFLRGASMHILNNTTGNKKSNYISVLVVAYNFCSESGYKLEVRNNLCFNTVTDNANPIIKQDTGDPLTDTSNNMYIEDPIKSGILLDTIECRLNPAGAAVDRAVAIPFIKTDIEGIHRPVGKAADIGARECPYPNTAGYEHPRHSASKKYLFIGIGFITISAFILALKKGAHKKNSGSRAGAPYPPAEEG